MNKKLLVASIAVVTTAAGNLSAGEYEYVDLADICKTSEGREIQLSEKAALGSIGENLPRKARVSKPTRSEEEPGCRDITMPYDGVLCCLLDHDPTGIDSLVVRGPVNGVDIEMMWKCSFYGSLTVLNLEYAEIEGNRLPDNAFWHQEEQYTPGDDHIDCIRLRRIILPEGLEEIGENAFSYAINLKEINFPSTLKRIGDRCFSDCVRLSVNPVVFPEGFEEIGDYAFFGTTELTGTVTLPSTLKRINEGAFYSSKITECNFPEGLEEIGGYAFYGNRLKEAMLPNSCRTFTGAGQFALNHELERMSIPEGVTAIPDYFAENCIELRSIEFPSTLESVGKGSCTGWMKIESIRCAAPVPPVCLGSESNPDQTPFGEYTRAGRSTPVYVPVGSAELYRNAWGWNYFTNFIETDDFPSAGIDFPTADEGAGENATYDLFGRKVERMIPGNIYIRNGKKHIAR